MAHTRYQLQAPDKMQVWRVQNTTMTVATGAGIGCYFLLKRFSPGIKFPWDIAAPFVMFYLTHRATQVWQLPGLYESFLRNQSPLGSRSREILDALRTGGRLPSDEFGTKLPPPRSANDSAGSAEQGAAAFVDASQGASAPLSRFSEANPDLAAASPAADPWAGDGGLGSGSSLEGAPAWDDWDSGSQAKGPPRKKTWDEIRAAAAKTDVDRSH